MSDRELIGIAYSPWTEKARWTLQHHRIPYRYSEHLMIFGMPSLRWKMRKPFGDITVPALIDRSDGGVVRLGDSWDIALHADSIGQGPSLFPKDKLAEIERLNGLSERALDAARALTVDRTRNDPATQLEVLPPFIPSALRPPLRFIASVGLNYLTREFRIDDKKLESHEKELREILTELARLVKRADCGPLLGDFSYGDIVMAVILHFVSPPDPEFMKAGPATRTCWTHQALAQEFSDVVAWRNEIYQKHRKPRS